ncbi:uncharacterized protein [Typha angustifolia]|uniref:uncharacterized protein n=1 Tax=Typha angustifolia TaxID=59011 RepID=UPI003C300106
MASTDEAPSWADQWGAGGAGDDTAKNETKEKDNKKNKMANVKAAASTSLDKAKAAATVGAQKVKSGTTMGIKWVKNQYQKRTSK